MAQLLCGAHLKPCAIRATRVTEDCQFAIGPNNSVTTNALIRLEVTPDIEEGEEIIERNGCGEICVNLKDKDEIKRLDAELELCLRDAELIEILTGAPLVLNDDGDTIGGCMPVGQINCTGAFLEIWVKVATNQGKCVGDVAGGPQWARYVYPCARFTLGGNTFENGLNNVTLTGYIEPLPAPLDGPFSDWPGAEDIPSDVLECWAYDLVGPPDTACGYGVDVPDDANTGADDPLGGRTAETTTTTSRTAETVEI